MTIASQQAVLRFQPAALTKGLAQLHGRAERGHEAGVLPWLLHEVASAEAHGLDRKINAPPRRHDYDRQEVVVGAQALEQVESFRPGRRVAGVVEIDEHDVEDARTHGAV